MNLQIPSRELMALNWLLRLPLLGAYELSMLLDIHEEESRRLLLDLAHAGWLEAGVASSPELEPDRLYALSRSGVMEMAKATDSLPSPARSSLLLDPREIDALWDRVEATVGLNRFLAELVLAVRSSLNLRLEGLRALPQRRGPHSWWPAGVDAYGCLSSRNLSAPFFVAWDRAAAPRVHRKKRLWGWNAFSREAAHTWAYEVPPVLILCPNREASCQWARAAQNAEERAAGQTMPCSIAEMSAIFSADPLDELWRAC